MSKLSVVIFFSLFITLIALLNIQSISAETDYLNIEIDNDSGYTLENYQMIFDFNSSNLDFSNVVSNGTSVKFKLNDIELPYYVLSWNSETEVGSIMVKISEIPQGQSVINLEYDLTIEDTSSAINTYDLYFDGTALNGLAWCQSASGYVGTISSGYIYIYGNGYPVNYAGYYITFSKPSYIQYKTTYRAYCSAGHVDPRRVIVWVKNGSYSGTSRVSYVTTATNWYSQSHTVSEVVGDTTSTFLFGVHDNWSANWSQKGYFDDIKIYKYVSNPPTYTYSVPVFNITLKGDITYFGTDTNATETIYDEDNGLGFQVTVKVTNSSDPDGDNNWFALLISEYPDFSSLYHNSSFVDNPSDLNMSFTKDMPRNRYWYARLDNYDARGGTNSSDVFKVYLGNHSPNSITISSPLDLAEVDNPVVTLEWELPSPEDTDGENVFYTAYLYDSESNLEGNSGFGDGRVSYETNSLNVGTYTWKVVAKDIDINGTYMDMTNSSYYTFEIVLSNTMPSIPVLVSPVNWSTGVDLNVSLDWEDSIDTEDDNFTYTLKINYIAPDGTSVTIEKADLNSSEYTLHDLGLYTGTQHQWAVKSVQTIPNIYGDVTLGYSSYWNFKTTGDRYGMGGTTNQYKVNIISAYNSDSSQIETNMWLELNGIILTDISNPVIVMLDNTNSSVYTFNTGTTYSNGIYKDTYVPSNLNGLYTLKGNMTYKGNVYYGIGHFRSGTLSINDSLDTITTTTGSSYVDIQTIMATTNTIDWSDVESIKTKTDTIDWADVDSIVTLSGEIKAKTDTIVWTTISAIKLKTDTILWTDITTIKAKTNTIVWTDVTAIKTNTDTIDWEDIEYIYTTSGEIKTRTDTILWTDILAIKTKTSLINWTDITAIKKKTDTILWTDITAIKKKTDTIKWSDIDSIKKTVESSFLSKVSKGVSSTVENIKYTFNGAGSSTSDISSGISYAFNDLIDGLSEFFGNIPRMIGLA